MGLWGSTMGAFGMGGSGGGTGGTAFSQFGQPPPPALPSQGIAPVPWGNGSEDPTRNPPPGGIIQRPTGPSPFQPGGTTRRGSQILDAQGNVIGHYDDNNQPVYHGGQGGGILGGTDNWTPPGWNTGWAGGATRPPTMPGGYGGGGPFGGVPPGWQSSDNGPALTPEQRQQQGLPPLGGSIPGPAPGFDEWMRQQQRLPPHRLGDPVASTSMGMAPSYARLGVPGSMQQSLYGNGLLRPAMPSMNNQSGY